MPKRVTLYIQDDKVLASLDLVLNKSGLVTDLLRVYFKEAERIKEEKDAKRENPETKIPKWG